MGDGVRESEASWRELLLELKGRGMSVDPKLAIADGALAFWKALSQVFPTTAAQRCWVHKSANVLDKMPKGVRPRAKTLVHDIYLDETETHAQKAFAHFCEGYRDRYPKAVETLEKDRELLMEVLGVIPGAVTPFGVQNDREGRATMVLDRGSVFGEILRGILKSSSPAEKCRRSECSRLLKILPL